MKEPGNHNLSEALEGQTPAAAPSGQPDEAGRPQLTPETTAEETRRRQQDRPDGIEDRDQRLTRVGRGQQTHG